MEIDRRLRAIQAELAPPAGGARASQPEPAEQAVPAAHGRDGPLADALRRAREAPRARDSAAERIERLASQQTQLVASLSELLDGFEHALHRLAPGLGQRPEPGPGPGGEPTLSVSAGPFTTIDAVRAFEHELRRLPGVAEVVVRGYEGSDRAVIDVRLA